ncbi:MAG: methyl-accepting chemotaxis protein [Desulfuromonas sp.]|nr:methyl-accepting chemotaxis protein [Desulfuromonas sp.]
MKQKTYRRKLLNLRVKRQLQIWLIIRVAGIVGLTSLVAVVILYGYAHQETVNSFYDAHIKIRRVSELLIPVVLSGGAISIISGIVMAIFLPQKIAGPLYHIERDLELIKAGNLSHRIRLRSNDTLHHFTQQINLATASIDSQIATAKQLCTELKQQQNGLNNEQQQLLEQLHHTLDKFITSGLAK